MMEMLKLGFVQRALVAGVCTGISCALIGTFLLPRRLALIGEGLGHFSIGVVGLALLLGWLPLPLLLPVLVLAALVIWNLPERATLYGDAAIGMVAVSGMALGVLLASVGEGFNVDLMSYLFGDILAVGRGEAMVAAVLMIVVGGVVWLLYYDLIAVTVDPEGCRVLGVRPRLIDAVSAVLAALTVGVGIRSVGAVLISGLLIFPAASALQVTGSVRGALLTAAAFSVVAVLLGIAAAFRLNWPAGPSIVVVCAMIFVACLAFGRARRRKGSTA